MIGQLHFFACQAVDLIEVPTAVAVALVDDIDVVRSKHGVDVFSFIFRQPDLAVTPCLISVVNLVIAVAVALESCHPFVVEGAARALVNCIML